MPDLEHALVCTGYASYEPLVVSDHRPVGALLTMRAPPRMPRRMPEAAIKGVRCELRLLNLSLVAAEPFPPPTDVAPPPTDMAPPPTDIASPPTDMALVPLPTDAACPPPPPHDAALHSPPTDAAPACMAAGGEGSRADESATERAVPSAVPRAAGSQLPRSGVGAAGAAADGWLMASTGASTAELSAAAPDAHQKVCWGLSKICVLGGHGRCRGP